MESQKPEIDKIDIGKPLAWYEELTKAFPDYTTKKARLARLDIAINYLYNRLPGGSSPMKFLKIGLSPKISDFSIKLYNTLTEDRNRIMLGVNPFRQYIDVDLYYIPRPEEWNFLHDFRNLMLEDQKVKFINDLKKSPLNDGDFAKEKFAEIYSNIYENKIFEIADIAPLIKAKITDEFFVCEGENITITGWQSFCNWISEIDYAKWLYKIINSTGTQKLNDMKATKNGVVLLYYYLGKNNGESLFDPGVPQKAAIRFSLNVSTLKRANSKFESNKIVSDAHNTNANVAKLHDLEFATAELQKSKNTDAYKEALKDLTNLRKILNSSS